MACTRLHLSVQESWSSLRLDRLDTTNLSSQAAWGGQADSERWVAQQKTFPETTAVQDSVNKLAASAASPGYVKFQAVIKSAASAASLRGGRASGRLDHGYVLHFLAALAAKEIIEKCMKIAFWGLRF